MQAFFPGTGKRTLILNWPLKTTNDLRSPDKSRFRRTYPYTAPMMANRLRELREGEGLSRAALAREARLSDRTLKRIEDGEKGYRPTPVTMNKLRNALNRVPTASRSFELADIFPDHAERGGTHK